MPWSFVVSSPRLLADAGNTTATEPTTETPEIVALNMLGIVVFIVAVVIVAELIYRRLSKQALPPYPSPIALTSAAYDTINPLSLLSDDPGSESPTRRSERSENSNNGEPDIRSAHIISLSYTYFFRSTAAESQVVRAKNTQPNGTSSRTIEQKAHELKEEGLFQLHLVRRLERLGQLRKHSLRMQHQCPRLYVPT